MVNTLTKFHPCTANGFSESSVLHKSSLGRLFVSAAMYQKITKEVLKEGKTGMGKWTLETKPIHRVIKRSAPVANNVVY